MKPFFTLDLAIEFYQVSKDLRLPSHLKDQYLRACSSIAMNLSEGSAKPTVADRRLHGQNEASIVKKADFLGACLYRLCEAVR